MKKNNLFFKSTIYLVIGGFITRTIGFIIRIIYTRIIKDEGIALLSVVMPTYSILLTITSMALPVVISKLVAENKKRAISIMSNAAFMVIILNILVIVIMHFLSGIIANYLLHVPAAKDLLIIMTYVFPIISIGAIIKGYFTGKQQTLPYMISNVLEQILRLILIMLIIPLLYKKSVYSAVKGLLLLSIITETFSIIVFLFFLPRKLRIQANSIYPNINMEKEILSLSIPTVSGKIIGNIGYFLEPIILTNLLMKNGYTKNFILLEYGAYNAYALSILTIPAFLIAAISNAIIPEISKHFGVRNDRMVKKRIKQSLIPIFLLGILFSILIIIFRNPLLSILYNTNKGSNYILFLAPFFPLFYLENILYSILQACGYARKAMNISLTGVICKIGIMSTLCFLKIGIYSLIVAEICNIIIVIIMNYKALKVEKLI